MIPVYGSVYPDDLCVLQYFVLESYTSNVKETVLKWYTLAYKIHMKMIYS